MSDNSSTGELSESSPSVQTHLGILQGVIERMAANRGPGSNGTVNRLKRFDKTVVLMNLLVGRFLGCKSQITSAENWFVESKFSKNSFRLVY